MLILFIIFGLVKIKLYLCGVISNIQVLTRKISIFSEKYAINFGTLKKYYYLCKVN